MLNRVTPCLRLLPILEAICLGGLVTVVMVSIGQSRLHQHRVEAAQGVWCVQIQAQGSWENLYGQDCQRVSSGYLRWHHP